MGAQAGNSSGRVPAGKDQTSGASGDAPEVGLPPLDFLGTESTPFVTLWEGLPDETPQGGPDKALGRNIRHVRERIGMSQSALADLMVESGHPSWRQTTVSRFEGSGRRLLPGELESLVRIFGPGLLEGTPSKERYRKVQPGFDAALIRVRLNHIDRHLREVERLLAEIRGLVDEHEAEADGEH